jgi:hypothetical protein
VQRARPWLTSRGATQTATAQYKVGQTEACQPTSLALITIGQVRPRPINGYGKLTTFVELLGKRTLIFNARTNLRRFPS